MRAATILCLVAGAPNGTTLVCRDNMHIRIAGIETGERVPRNARHVLTRRVVGQSISCLPAGNEGSFVVAKCTLPDGRDLACTLIETRAAVRSEASWRRYGLQDC